MADPIFHPSNGEARGNQLPVNSERFTAEEFTRLGLQNGRTP